MIVSIMLTSEDEFVLQCMSDSDYAERHKNNTESTENDGYYIGDTGYGDTLEVCVTGAHIIKDTDILEVVCEITNISSEEIEFTASDYFSVSIDGVSIDAGYSDYDLGKISTGASFKATIRFALPNTSDKKLSNMTMTADTVEFNLVNRK